MEFVLIPAGEFMMGSTDAQRQQFLVGASHWAKDRIAWEGPQHKVKISKPFYLGKYEVTQAQWQAVMGNNPSQFKGPLNPVEKVSWDDIQPFLLKLNASFEKQGMVFGLPAEAGWEYACRAGTTTAFGFGDNPALHPQYGWLRGNAGGKTHPVGQGRPNAWGLYDMHGNVWELCSDRYAKDFYAQSPPVDPVGPPTGSSRVYRGGSWDNHPEGCRSAFRHYDSPSYRAGAVGFRLALVRSDLRAVGAIATTARPSPIPPKPKPPKLSKELTVDLPGGAKMEFVRIPAGEFMMGSTEAEQTLAINHPEVHDRFWTDKIPSEGPQHKVKVTNPFYMGKYEVTQSQWESVMGSNPSEFPGPLNPVDKVSWDDVQGFISKLNATLEKKGMRFGLPTEAAWEYACRAGTKTAYSFGDHSAMLAQHGWSSKNSERRSHPVGQGKPNAWGLYDMHGNVWEWCSDWHAKDFYAQSPPADPTGPAKGSHRVFRGGSWSHPPRHCRAAYRLDMPPGQGRRDLGFRLALVSSKEIGRPESVEARESTGHLSPAVENGMDENERALLAKLLARIDARDLPKGYEVATHQQYVDRRKAGLTEEQWGRVVRLWEEKQKLHRDPRGSNRAKSFVKIMEYVADDVK